MVWDTIHARDVRDGPVEEWGGIGYALEALSVTLPPSWEIAPIVKVGEDLAEPAFHYLRTLPRIRLEPGVRVVAEPNNRVELRYRNEERRTERLTGGVSSWAWPELAPLVRECDALYVNFISGREMELETARSVRASFRGPMYADLHSLFLGVTSHGDRFPRPLPFWSEWLRSFDAVQMNEDEFHLLGRARGDPWRLAAEEVGPELKLIAVTLGAEGAAYVAGPGFCPDPFSWPELRDRIAMPGASRSGKVSSEAGPEEGDPTGCGDVWGATFFSMLLAGSDLEKAMSRANEIAQRNVQHRGARGLRYHLQNRLPGETGG